MKKMGWGGAGLGQKEQGRQDPINAGDVRDTYDRFKGLGMEINDPYENYRKNRSQGYNSRITTKINNRIERQKAINKKYDKKSDRDYRR